MVAIATYVKGLNIHWMPLTTGIKSKFKNFVLLSSSLASSSCYSYSLVLTSSCSSSIATRLSMSIAAKLQMCVT